MIDVEYAFQEIDKIPAPFTVPEGRVKPWGTTHALLCGREILDDGFCVINADDFYGRDAFNVISNWIDNADFNAKPVNYAMAAYKLNNTSFIFLYFNKFL